MCVTFIACITCITCITYHLYHLFILDLLKIRERWKAPWFITWNQEMLAHLKSIIKRTQRQEPNSNLTFVYAYMHFQFFWELGEEPNLCGSTTVVVSKRAQKNSLLTWSSSKIMGNSCGCTEQTFYIYLFGGWAHPLGRAQYWWCQITFPVSWLCGSSGWSCGKENIAKNPIMRLQIEREKMENLGRNLQLVVEKKKQFCENTAAVKRLLRSWKMILQI